MSERRSDEKLEELSDAVNRNTSALKHLTEETAKLWESLSELLRNLEKKVGKGGRK